MAKTAIGKGEVQKIVPYAVKKSLGLVDPSAKILETSSVRSVTELVSTGFIGVFNNSLW